MIFFGEGAERNLPIGEAYRRISSSKDFPLLLQLVDLSSGEKIPYIARLVKSYIGNRQADADLVNLFLELKVIILSI
jgi:hypothetical protein